MNFGEGGRGRKAKPTKNPKTLYLWSLLYFSYFVATTTSDIF